MLFLIRVDVEAVNDLARVIHEASMLSPKDNDVVFSVNSRTPVSDIQVDPAAAGIDEKIGLFRQADEVARSHGREVIQVRSVFSDENRRSGNR